jgi:signal peptidase I
VQQYLIKPFKIPSGSMENTLRCRDRILAERVSYRFTDPARGDVIVFSPPAAVVDGVNDPSTVAGTGGASISSSAADGTRTVVPADINYIKRVIGLPGDKVLIKNHRATVNGKKLDEPYLHPLADDGSGDTSRANWPASGEPYIVPKGMYLVLGDHRDASEDGRFFGPLPRDFIVGKAIWIYWPIKNMGRLPESDPGGKTSSTPDPNCIDSGAPVSVNEPPADPTNSDG